MKKLLFIMFVFMALAGITSAQKAELLGSWLMTKAEVNGEVQTPYFVTEFKEDGRFFVMGMDAGTWEFNTTENSIIMKSELDKDFNGEEKVLKLSKKELLVDKNGAKLLYRKIDAPAIEKENEHSGLFGMWEFTDEPYAGVITLLTFSAPDEFTMIQKEEGSVARLSGTWIFDQEEALLFMIGLRGEDILHGENKVIRIHDDAMELESNGKLFKAKRKAKSAQKIERLCFTEADFYTEEGDYKYYEDEEKLPWRDFGEMKMGLLNIKQLVYNYATLINGTDAFENKTLTADVQASLEEEGFSVDNIFIGYDRYNLPEDAAFPENTEYYKPLYPLMVDIFRVVGNEQITTPAGTFDCTVVEAIADSGARMKMWMISDKLGVYAKVIVDDPDDSFGYYFVYELKEIK